MKVKIIVLLIAAAFIISCEVENTVENPDSAVPAWDKKVEIMPLKDVKRGMRGVGLTVYKGALPQKFYFEVLGVKKIFNNGPTGSPVIVVRLTEGPLEFPTEKTGVVAGMSGSPMYVRGKLIGALAYGFTDFAKDPICGIQPIELMLNPKAVLEMKGVVSTGKVKVIPIVLAISGEMADTFSTKSRFDDDIFKTNFVVKPQAGYLSIDGETDKSNLRMQPGSSLAVYLVKGDVTLSATGTVTVVDGNKIYAFGHSFLGAGQTEMSFHQNEIITIDSSYESSSKMSGGEVGSAEGAITNDYFSAISGIIGQTAKTISFKMDLYGSKSNRTLNMQIVNARGVATNIIKSLIPKILLASYKEFGAAFPEKPQRMETAVEIRFDNGLPALEIKMNLILAKVSFIFGPDAVWDFARTITSVLSVIEKKGGLKDIMSINIKAVFSDFDSSADKSESVQHLNIKDLDSKEKAIPGKTLPVEIVVYTRKGREKIEYTITVPVPVLKNIETGEEKLEISVGNGYELITNSDLREMNLKDAISYFNNYLKQGLFLTVRYDLEREIKNTEADTDVKFGNIGSSNLKKITGVTSKKVIYAVPLPAFLSRADCAGKKEKSFDVEKEEKKKDTTKKPKKKDTTKKPKKKDTVKKPKKAKKVKTISI